MSDIRSRLDQIRATIANTARESGRRADDIKLIAVSKTHPTESLRAALGAGQKAFGENTVQEALGKIAHFEGDSGPAPEWHFIGHLQSNKAKLVPGNFGWFHSLDSAKLAHRLSRAAVEHRATLNTLIEVNVTQDPRKHGIPPTQLFTLLDQLLAEDLPGIALRGVMTIGPFPAAEAEIRRVYASLREWRDACRDRYPLPAFAELSMGMSGDYVEAIKEGATLLRIGTAIFGERDYG